MLKLSQHGFKFPETPSNRNLCTVVYNSYYSDRQLRMCLEKSIAHKHFSGNHRELNVHSITCDNNYNYYICYKRPHQALEASFNGISVGDFYIEPQQLRLYTNVHVPQCMHCYKWDNHPTSRCPNRNYSRACSLCLGYHNFKVCPSYNNKQIPPVCRNCKGPHPAVSKGCRAAKEAERNGSNDRSPRPSNSYFKSNSNSKIWELTKPAKFYDPDSGQMVGYNPHLCRPYTEKRPQQQTSYNNSSPQAVKNSHKKPAILSYSKKPNNNIIPYNKERDNIPCQQEIYNSSPKDVKTSKTYTKPVTHTDTNVKSKYTFKAINSSHKKLQQLVDSNNLCIQDVTGDGDCFYHAICIQTNTPKNSGGALRQEFIKYLYNLPKKNKN